MSRKPSGYVGANHQTIGSDILAVLHTLTFPRGVLGDEVVAALESIRADQWYPIATLLDLLETLDQKIGATGLRKVGRTLFKASHEARVLQVASSARDIVHGIDSMYKHANKGVGIGGWTVRSFEPGRATLEKNTPHHCALEEGILDGAMTAVQSPSTIVQSECFRKGAPVCVYVITSRVQGARWDGGKPSGAPGGP